MAVVKVKAHNSTRKLDFEVWDYNEDSIAFHSGVRWYFFDKEEAIKLLEAMANRLDYWPPEPK
jgi:hypothetical protein